jgi:putative transposase
MSEKSKLVEMHVSVDTLDKHVRELEKVAKKVNRLHFIQQMYKGHSVRKTCSILNVPIRTGYNWLKKWNDEGLNGLNHKKGAGRPPFISETQLKEFDKYLSEMTLWEQKTLIIL